MWHYLAIIVAACAALWLFHNGAYKSGANSQKVIWQAEKIIVVEKTTAAILAINKQVREKEQDNIIAANVLVRKHRTEKAEDEKERIKLLADIRDGNAKWLRLASESGDSGSTDSETSTVGFGVDDTEGSQLRIPTQYDLAEIALDANRNTKQLATCQAQLLADRL